MCKRKSIFKGFHRPIGLPAFLSPIGFLRTCDEYKIRRKVAFFPNCAYDLKNGKQKDWNKLFGVSLGVLGFKDGTLYRGVHYNSIRFGWRYSIEKACIELCAIIYKDAFPSREYIHDLQLDRYAELLLEFEYTTDNEVNFGFYVNGELVYDGFIDNVSALVYYGCGLYFGGKSKAPHKITVEIGKD